MKVKRPVQYNPKNNQLTITLPKNKLAFLKTSTPPKKVALTLSKGDFEW